MVKKKFHILSIILALVLVFGFFPMRGQAATVSDTYGKEISIGFTSMVNISSLSFTLTGDYLIAGQSVILNSGNAYRIDLNNSIFSLYENNILLFSTVNDIQVKPLISSSYISFLKAGSTRFFSGSMTFKKNVNSFIPVNTLKIEDYLKGVVPYEEGESFPLEALKAQAIAARTYAITNISKYITQGYNLSDDTNSQVYEGYNPTYTVSNIAVDATKGQVLTSLGNTIQTFYSSSNGGYTERAENVWDTSLPYIIDVPDSFDLSNTTPSYIKNWSVGLSLSDISTFLKVKHPELNAKQFVLINIPGITYFKSGRISNMDINYIDNTDSSKILHIGKAEARSFFNLKSALYKVTLNTTDGKYYFNGSGYGYGLGMSQYGSLARAKSGQDYKTILNFYYPNTTLTNLSSKVIAVNILPRIGGEDRFSTSIKIADAESISSGKLNSIVIASGYNFPDGLSGSVLAKSVGSPMLLVGNTPDSVDSSLALNYISSHLNKSGKVYILGGTGVISQSFDTKFTNMGYIPIRLGGTDRIETSLKIANQLNVPTSTTLVLSSEDNFPDALSISPIAAHNGWPILLTDNNILSKDVENYILKVKPDKIYITGGTGVISDNVKNRLKTILGYNDYKVVRLGGSDRYATSRIINSTLVQDPSDVMVSSGLNYPDALSGSVYAALKGAPILLMDSGETIEGQNYIKYVGSNGNTINITAFGLQGAVSDSVLNTLRNLSN